MVITVCSKPEVQWVAPRRADLMWGLGCRSSFEPRRRQDPTDGRFARKPTTVVAGHSGDTPVGILDATSPSRRASHPPSGQYAFVPPPDRRFVEVLAVRGPVPMIGGAPVLAGATTAAVVVLSAAVMVAIVDGMRVWRTGP